MVRDNATPAILRLATDLTRTMGLKKSELAAIVWANPEDCMIIIKRTPDGFWGVTLRLLATGLEHELLTERGQVKSWRDPAAAVQLVQDLCPERCTVLFAINDWVFARQPTMVRLPGTEPQF